MSDIETRLTTAWNEDLPAARDGVFRIAVLERLERRAYAVRLTAVFVLGFLASALVWFTAPPLMSGLAAVRMSSNDVVAILAILSLAPLAWGLNRAFKAI